MNETALLAKYLATITGIPTLFIVIGALWLHRHNKKQEQKAFADKFINK